MKPFFLNLSLMLAGCGNVVSADTKADVHVVIAVDQSESMFKATQWASVQANAFADFFRGYAMTCLEVRVTYIVWGGVATEVVQTNLASGWSMDLAQAISEGQFVNLEGTDHYVGLTNALGHFGQGERNILIFTTDEPSMRPTGADLHLLIPTDVEVYAISIGRQLASTYVRAHIVPTFGHHYHADNGQELGSKIAQVLNRITSSLCIS